VEITGITGIYSLIGGFHLTGKIFEPIIGPTIEALERFSPKIIVPQHCTGWRATQEISRRFPDAFIPTSVGTSFVL
jgi:7,8-dihydropterin-6-yl-methyl-4-(beta-D-ribofuranosyl)aminobenzene 5'-phosphate synthase